VSEDVSIQVGHADAHKVNHIGVPRELAVRIYCSASPRSHREHARWNLQVRAPMKLARGREGRDFIVSTASMSIEALTTLRDAINRAIREYNNAMSGPRPKTRSKPNLGARDIREDGKWPR
jgi:hypothetical protein